VVRLLGNGRSRKKEGRRLHHRDVEVAALRPCADHHDGRRPPLLETSTHLNRRHDDAGAIRDRDHGRILLLLFRVRWRLLPLGIVLIGVVWASAPRAISGYR